MCVNAGEGKRVPHNLGSTEWVSHGCPVNGRLHCPSNHHFRPKIQHLLARAWTKILPRIHENTPFQTKNSIFFSGEGHRPVTSRLPGGGVILSHPTPRPNQTFWDPILLPRIPVRFRPTPIDHARYAVCNNNTHAMFMVLSS